MQHPFRNLSLKGTDPQAKREAIRRYFHQTFSRYEQLFETLTNDAAFYARPEKLRQPLIFYFGHTAVFFINKLILAKHLARRIDPKLESIFAVGVDEMDWDDLREDHYEWPTVEATRAYRNRVRQTVDALIDTLPLELPIGWDSPFWPILMGIEHEHIHLETSSVLIRQSEQESVQEHPVWPACTQSGNAPDNSLLPVPGGNIRLGKQADGNFYGWDNEYGMHATEVADFRASKYLVSNQEFLEFVKDGGYREARWWSREGVAWRNARGASHPIFWIPGKEDYRYRTMTRTIDLPLDWPVDVNCHEAEAFCRWLGARKGIPLRLPTEEEYARLADFAGPPSEETWGDKAPANINLEHYASACPVSTFAHGDFFDVIGNVWQWTGTPIYPFEGFKIHPLYDDFSTPTFDDRHYLIKGGAFISTGNEMLPSSRYAFRKHFFQHAGFRYVQGSAEMPPAPQSNIYEQDQSIVQYCEFGWGDTYFNVPNFPRTCADIVLNAMQERPARRALDVGCAIGRSTFELAKGFEEVTGIDFSARFIQHAQRMAHNGKLRYLLPVEGELAEPKEVWLPEHLHGLESKIAFWQADACNLKPIFKEYDLIFAGNLIDRLYDPAKFLRDALERLNPGGVLVLTSPYTWLETFTPKARWIGGFKQEDRPLTTLEGLQNLLEPDARLLETRDIPFVIRETARKFQHSVAQMSLWEKC